MSDALFFILAIVALGISLYMLPMYIEWFKIFVKRHSKIERVLNNELFSLIIFVGAIFSVMIIIQNKLNHRPRKVLHYKTPYEIFFSELSRKLAA